MRSARTGVALLACVMASCISDPRDRRDAAMHRSDSGLELDVEMPAIEAACLVAEALAYEFPNTQRDKLRPVARAVRESDRTWKVAYVRARGASYLPLANGYFTRECEGTRIAHSKPRSQPFELLPELRFVPSAVTGVRNGPDYVAITIQGSGADRCSIRASVRGEAWLHHHVAKLEGLLRGAGAIRKALESCGRGELIHGTRTLGRALAEHRRGFSHVHDPLLANANASLGRCLLELGELDGARLAFARSRILMPASGSMLAFESRLQERLAQVRASAEGLTDARLETPKSGLTRMRVRALEAAGRELAERARHEESSRAIAERLLDAGDIAGATAWSERALDQAPGTSRALVLQARTLRARGAHRHAKQTLRLADLAPQNDTETRGKIRQLLTLDGRGVHPALAFRQLLRSSKVNTALLSGAYTKRLASQIGRERCLRICQSEGVDVRFLVRALEWMQEEDNDRERFLRDVLVSGARHRSAGPLRIGIGQREVEADRIGASSGLRPRAARPNTTSPASPAK